MNDVSTDIRPCQHCTKILHWERRVSWMELWLDEDGSVTCTRSKPGQYMALPHEPMPTIGDER